MTAIEGNASGGDWAARDGVDQTGASSASLHRRPLSLSRDRVADAPPALCAALPDAPPAVLAALYGRNAPQHAYLLVDGTLRAQVAGLFDLDVIDAPARSLFDGDSSEEAGPWLVDLSIRDTDAPRNIRVLRDFFARHWAAGFSLLISTDVPFDALRSHLRRFTRLPVLDDGRVLTFRFWDPRVLDPFLQAISADRSRLRRMMMTDAGQMIAYVLPPTEAADGTASHVAPAPDLSAEPVRAMRLRYADFDATARAKAAARRARMAQRLRADFAPELADRSDTEIRAAVDAAVFRFEAFGFRDHAHLHFFAAWTLFYGPRFEQGDPTQELETILRSDAPAGARFLAFRRRFETFTLRGSA